MIMIVSVRQVCTCGKMPPKCNWCRKNEARSYTCRKTGEKKYRTKCEVCAAKVKEYCKERKKRKLEANPQACVNCFNRDRVQGKTVCQPCLDGMKKQKKDPNSLPGLLHQKWFKWKRTHACVECGYTGTALQADHIIPETKLKQLSDINKFQSVIEWIEESNKCQPLCAWCHQLKTRDETNRDANTTASRHRAILNAEKHKRGCCSASKCKRPVTEGEERCFVFKKIDKKKSNINGCVSRMVRFSEAKFNRLVGPELSNCKMLCQNCFYEL